MTWFLEEEVVLLARLPLVRAPTHPPQLLQQNLNMLNASTGAIIFKIKFQLVE